MINTFLNKIFCGNNLDILQSIPQNTIDLTITSPPYNKGEKQKGWLVKNIVYDNSTDNKSEEDYQIEQIKLLDTVFSITKEGGSFFYNHKTRWDKGQMIHPLEWILKSKWCLKQEIIWNKNIAANIRGWRFWQIDERIYWLYKPIKNNKIGKELLSKHALLTSIWNLIPDKNISHPASFPITLPTRIIYSIMNDENGIVLDPYCGSGTTLVAAKFLNKNFIGIDISPKYVDISKKRLQDYTQEESKIQEELNKHLVIKTFTERKQEKKYKNIDSQKQSNLTLF